MAVKPVVLFMVIVPLPVIGLLATVSQPASVDKPTLVTVPATCHVASSLKNLVDPALPPGSGTRPLACDAPEAIKTELSQ